MSSRIFNLPCPSAWRDFPGWKGACHYSNQSNAWNARKNVKPTNSTQNRNTPNKNGNNPPFPATEYNFLNPHLHRFADGLIANVATLAKGVYIFETPTGHTYVGSSINLFVRVTSYFYSSILKSGTRKLLVHFFQHGFEGVKLTLFIMDPSSTIEMVLLMEQFYLDKYFNHPSNLN